MTTTRELVAAEPEPGATRRHVLRKAAYVAPAVAVVALAPNVTFGRTGGKPASKPGGKGGRK